jgi:hypothetical protein
MDKPLIIPNFVSDQDCMLLASYIEDTHLSYTGKAHDDKRFIDQFGKDNYHKKSKLRLEGLGDIHPIIVKYFEKILSTCQTTFADNDKMDIASIWFSKQIQGSVLPVHSDVDDGSNDQVSYSVVLYLNSVDRSGELQFPTLDFSYKPQMGDAVIWKSDDVRFDHGVSEIVDTRYSLPIWVTKHPEYFLPY